MIRQIPLPVAVSRMNRAYGLNVKLQRAREWAIAARFPAVQVDGRWLIAEQDLPAVAAAFGAELERAA